MRADYKEGVLRIEGVRFDPQLTLIDSAQVFHWKKVGDAYAGYSCRKAVRLEADSDGFSLFGVGEADIAFWLHYFDLNRDYDFLIDVCAAQPVAQEAICRLPGLRVLNQPVWEALIAFILSANNNVGRIRQLVERLTSAFDEEGFFPTPERLAGVSEEALRGIGCGYRAPYLIRTAEMVCAGFPLDALSAMPYEEAHAQLLTLPGVGDKVADCVQLFGLGHSRAFPVDVWVERLMRRWFMPDVSGKKEIRRKAHEMFGEYAGLVQQSLFHCARLGLISLDEDGKTSSTEERS